MFWIGFAAGIMATLAFLVTEHLIGQMDWKTTTALGKAFSPMLFCRGRQLLNWKTSNGTGKSIKRRASRFL